MRRDRRASAAVWAASRRLRHRETEAERVLWRALRRRRLGDLDFRRQHALGAFVLDFYCPALHLAIEVDGGVHDDPDRRHRDEQRTRALAAVGITILRFTNSAVTANLVGVLSTIAAASSPRGALPAPPPSNRASNPRAATFFDS